MRGDDALEDRDKECAFGRHVRQRCFKDFRESDSFFLPDKLAGTEDLLRLVSVGFVMK